MHGEGFRFSQCNHRMEKTPGVRPRGPPSVRAGNVNRDGSVGFIYRAAAYVPFVVSLVSDENGNEGTEGICAVCHHLSDSLTICDLEY